MICLSRGRASSERGKNLHVMLCPDEEEPFTGLQSNTDLRTHSVLSVSVYVSLEK